MREKKQTIKNIRTEYCNFDCGAFCCERCELKVSDCVSEGEGSTPSPGSVSEGSYISSELHECKTKKKERGREKGERRNAWTAALAQVQWF